MEIFLRLGRSKSSVEARSRAKELALSSVIAGAHGVGTIAITPVDYGSLRLTSPGVGEMEKVKRKTTLYVSLTAMFAALYAAGVVALAPISFQVFQVRVADALLPLAILFGWPAVLGFSVGAFVANFFGGLGVVDVLGGSVANFLATYTAWKIGQRKSKTSWLAAVAIEILVVTVIVGSYLSYLFQMPLEIGLLGILLGSFVAVGLLGYALLLVFSRPIITNQLKSYGLTVYRKEA